MHAYVPSIRGNKGAATTTGAPAWPAPALRPLASPATEGGQCLGETTKAETSAQEEAEQHRTSAAAVARRPRPSCRCAGCCRGSACGSSAPAAAAAAAAILLPIMPACCDRGGWCVCVCQVRPKRGAPLLSSIIIKTPPLCIIMMMSHTTQERSGFGPSVLLCTLDSGGGRCLPTTKRGHRFDRSGAPSIAAIQRRQQDVGIVGAMRRGRTADDAC